MLRPAQPCAPQPEPAPASAAEGALPLAGSPWPCCTAHIDPRRVPLQEVRLPQLQACTVRRAPGSACSTAPCMLHSTAPHSCQKHYFAEPPLPGSLYSGLLPARSSLPSVQLDCAAAQIRLHLVAPALRSQLLSTFRKHLLDLSCPHLDGDAALPLNFVAVHELLLHRHRGQPDGGSLAQPLASRVCAGTDSAHPCMCAWQGLRA